LKQKLEAFSENAEQVTGDNPEEPGHCEKPWRHHGPGHHGPGHHGPGHHGRPGCHSEFHHHESEVGYQGGRGRGCRGKWAREAAQQEKREMQDGDQPIGKKWAVPKETWIQFQESKENLKVARKSGDAEAIKQALEAFVIAKQLKKEHRYPKA